MAPLNSVPGIVFTNPVINEEFPDAAYTRGKDGRHILIATPKNGQQDFQIAVAEDAIHFQILDSPVITNYPKSWRFPRNLWAPEIVRRGNEWRMYFATDVDGKEEMGIMVAVSSDGYRYVIDPDRNGFIVAGNGFSVIDPAIFHYEDTDYLIYGSAEQPIRICKLGHDGYRLSEPRWVSELLFPSETGRYFRLLEAGGVIQNNDQFFLLFSGDNVWSYDRYALMATSATNPFGPYLRVDEAKIILLGNRRFANPGQVTFFTDDASDLWAYYLAVDLRDPYLAEMHPHFGTPQFRRVTCLDKVSFDSIDGYPIIGDRTPSWLPQIGPKWFVKE